MKGMIASIIRTVLSSILFSILVLGGVLTISDAATLSVPSPECGTIQKAIDMAQGGDTILISPGTYQENLLIDGKSVNLQGEDRDRTILDGGDKSTCIILKNGSNGKMSGLTIRNGNALGNKGEGGGIACYQSNPRITGNTFRYNSADRGQGAGIFCHQSSSIIEHNEFYKNQAPFGEGAGVYAFRSSPIVQNNSFIENQAIRGAGGAISFIECPGGEIGENSFTRNQASQGEDIHRTP